jgi:hypothetical protein
VKTRVSRILLATSDPGLRESRTAVLRCFGFDVTASKSTQHALELIGSRSFDLLVLGNTLTPDACREISIAFRRCRPTGRIVEILPASGVDCKSDPDVSVVGLDGPIALRGAIDEQLRLARKVLHLTL